MGYLPRKVSVTSGTVRYTCGSASGGEMEGCDSVSRWRQGIRRCATLLGRGAVSSDTGEIEGDEEEYNY